MNIKQIRQIIREEIKEFKSSSEMDLENRIRQVFLMDKWELSKKQYAGMLKNLVKTYGKSLVAKIVGELEKYGSIEAQGSKIVWNEAKDPSFDTLGSEDDDVNNDGEVDDEDSYLKHRRDFVTKAIKSKKESKQDNKKRDVLLGKKNKKDTEES